MPVIPATQKAEEGWGRTIAWTWEAEVVVSQDWNIALQPGLQEWNSILKKKKKKEKLQNKQKTSNKMLVISPYYQKLH